MPDPFLAAHSLGPLHYGLGGKISPVSIRDQMLRGRVIIDRALEVPLLGVDRPLLVIGAGAAGVTTAIHATKHGIPTTLIDKNSVPLSRQRQCRSRWICPTQYDWPLDHWQVGEYPWEGPDMPLLPWVEDYANWLAVLWLTELNLTRLAYKNLRYLPKTTIDWKAFKKQAAKKRDYLEVQFKPQGRSERFGMVVFSTGFGTEVCRVGNYRGFRFWDTDQFEEPYLGVKTSSAPRVLISGAGDGALQDYLRIVTKRESAKSIYTDVIPSRIREVIEKRIFSAEDQAQRAFIWDGNWHHDHDVYEVIHQVHLETVEELIQNADVWPEIRDALDVIIDASPDARTVELVHPCNHFFKCYGLNHFLVLLITRYLEERWDFNPLTQDTLVAEIKGLGHACNKSARQCHGKEHAVAFKYADCETLSNIRSVADQPETGRSTYEVIVVRHGLETTNPRGYHAVYSRHLLPYYVAWGD